MATITQIEQQVNNLAVRIAAEIDLLRVEMGSITGATPDWNDITGKPTTFTPSAHTHVAAEITDFNAGVDARIALAGGGDAPDWASITGKPTEFPPEDHTHVVADITDFTAEVNSLIAAAGAGDGNVVGPAGGVVDGEIAVYNGVLGTAIKASGIVPSANGVSLIEAADYAAMKALLDLEIGTDVQAYHAKLAAVSGMTWAADKGLYATGVSTIATYTLSSYMRGLMASTDSNAARSALDDKESLLVAISDETTSITTGTAKITFRAPYAMALDLPKGSLSTAGTTSTTIDINVNGISILSTKLTIDANEKTSVTAATPAAMTSTPFAVAADDEVTIDVDVAGTGAKGAKVTFVALRL